MGGIDTYYLKYKTTKPPTGDTDRSITHIQHSLATFCSTTGAETGVIWPIF